MIDIDRLAAWMDERGLGEAGAPIEHRFVSGGTQNEIYEIRRGELHGALRIPPSSAPAPRDDGILREWRIIEALDGTDVPHTPAIAACDDPAVLGRAFYVMLFVDGWSPMDADTSPATSSSCSVPEAASGTIPRIPLNLVLLKGIEIRGFQFAAFATHAGEDLRRNEAELLALFADGRATPHIGAAVDGGAR